MSKTVANTSYTDEQERILLAAAAGRLGKNEHGRWVIDGAKRPARKDREKLLTLGLLTWPHYRTSETITKKGRQVLAALNDQERPS